MVKHITPPGAIRRAQRLRANMTDAERKLWYVLKDNFPAARFRKQVPIRHFTADFASHSARLVIEVDGSQHGGPDDAARTRLIEAEGYRVIRFWNNDVLLNPNGVATLIALALGEPSPLMGGARDLATKEPSRSGGGDVWHPSPRSASPPPIPTRQASCQVSISSPIKGEG